MADEFYNSFFDRFGVIRSGFILVPFDSLDDRTWVGFWTYTDRSLCRIKIGCGSHLGLNDHRHFINHIRNLGAQNTGLEMGYIYCRQYRFDWGLFGLASLSDSSRNEILEQYSKRMS